MSRTHEDPQIAQNLGGGRLGHGDTARTVDGGAFILDAPRTVPAIWGYGDDVAWAAGEPLLIVGPQGVGKTTLVQRLALARAGVRDAEVLGMAVEPGPGRVLYIAADRPRQIARSFRRMVERSDREVLSMGLVVWRGPLPFDLGKARPGQFLDFVQAFADVDTVVIDSLKDVAIGLKDDEVGARLNNEIQHLIAEEIEVAACHHQRKATSENRKPRTLADVFGSTWITSGSGSVLLLWGEAGDPIVDLRHLKQPSGEIGPAVLQHDHKHGVIDLHEPADPLALLAQAGGHGLSAQMAASELFGSDRRADVEKARRRLERLVREKVARRIEGNQTRYVLIQEIAA